MSLKHAALILAGHGSTLNADSSEPTYLHADGIRKRGIFAEVHECFWKEEPHYRDVLRQVDAKVAYIVPLFISRGYFTEKVLPREFEVTPGRSILNGKEICYCEPVGAHPGMTQVLLHRAQTVLGSADVDLSQTCLFIAGHGTNLNENSTVIIYEQVKKISEMGIYGECRPFFMEQKPLIKEWMAQTKMPNVIVVPFFISDGLHSYEDIPVMLGISENVKATGFKNPTEVNGRRVWYAHAIGTEPQIEDVILAQIDLFHETFGQTTVLD